MLPHVSALPAADGQATGDALSARKQAAASCRSKPMDAAPNGSDVEGLAAAALVLHVGVVELEPLVEAFAGEIEFHAVDIRQAFRIDHNLDAIALDHQILFSRFVDELKAVGHAGTAAGPHA